MNYENLKISSTQAENILFELFNIKGSATQLPGDVDFNFKISVENKNAYVLKISRTGSDLNYLDFQQKLLQYIQESSLDFNAPQVVKDRKGSFISEVVDTQGNLRNVRLLTWIEGRIWNHVNPQLDTLRYSLGEKSGLLTKALQGFDHPIAIREFEWDIAQSLWTKDQRYLFSEEERAIISYFQDEFESFQNTYKTLRKSIVHNDVNNHNIVVSLDLLSPTVVAAIDYGDAIFTQIINDLAIACAYAVMGHNNPLEAAIPLVKGYHKAFPIEEKELEHLYVAVAMRLIVSVTKSALNKVREPENEYLLISEKPAWEVLKKWRAISPDFAHFSFRNACGYTAHPNETKFKKWAETIHFSFSDLFPTCKANEVCPIDLSVSSKWIGHQEEFNDLDFFEFKIKRLQKEHPTHIIAGGYLEPRSLYTSGAYDKIGNHGRESRSVHLGIDCWLPAKTPVHALFDGVVCMVVNDAGEKEYGGLVILKHKVENLEFYSLYGHLSVESALKNKVGDPIKKGSAIANLGSYPENGNWAPHLHFQLMLSLLEYQKDFPGVAYHSQINVWESICPNPNLLFKSKTLDHAKLVPNEALISYRKKHLGKGLSLHYKKPIKMVRGARQYLMDQFGRKYLDTVNNVAHVGHQHFNVVKAGQEQMALINTNSRYLHENMNDLAKELMETLPSELNVLHFVNSGSEANELALRMARTVTGEKDVIASEVGYHGNTNLCVDISSYKFDGRGGPGQPEFKHIFPLPDTFRGKYQGENAGELYAKEIQKQLEIIHDKGRNVGAFIIEPILSCGGQIELPEGFLKHAYKSIREAGGICISDEIQSGCGRTGKSFWGFQLHDVLPDIITIGKPLGNGHPIGAVACTQKVADQFANGMEYFNTFGGNPVSCAIATEVLKTVKRENLQKNALEVGNYLKTELKILAQEFPIIGDVRGQGLFLGIELVDPYKNPLEPPTTYIVNRMKDHGILMSTDGSDNNVLKIKPPMVFTRDNAREVIYYLRKILKEDFVKSYIKD